MRHSLSPLLALMAFLLCACGQDNSTNSDGQRQNESQYAASDAPSQGTLEWAAAAPWRSALDRSVDPWREPVAVIEFFNIQPSDRVLEIWPTGGYWTTILAPYLAQGGGQYIGALAPRLRSAEEITLDQDDPQDGSETAQDSAFALRFSDARLFGDVSAVTLTSAPLAVEADSLDVVASFDDFAFLIGFGLADHALAEAYRVLRPGGRLVILQARGRDDQPQDLFAGSGYVREDFMRQLAREAGFEFVRASNVLANPDDTKDHPRGILSLPPLLQADEQMDEAERERFMKIGAPDRMVLVFRKPRQNVEPAP